MHTVPNDQSMGIRHTFSMYWKCLAIRILYYSDKSDTSPINTDPCV